MDNNNDNNTKEEIKVNEAYKKDDDKWTKPDALDYDDDSVTSRKRLKDEDASINVPEETSKSLQASEVLFMRQPPNYSHRSDMKLPGVESVLNSNNLQELDTSSSEEQNTGGALPSVRSLERGVAIMEALALQRLRKQENNPVQQEQQHITSSPEATSVSDGAKRKPQGNLPSVENFSEKERVFWLNIVTDMKNELTQQVSENNENKVGNKQTLDSALKHSYTCSECEKTFARQCDLKCDISFFLFSKILNSKIFKFKQTNDALAGNTRLDMKNATDVHLPTVSESLAAKPTGNGMKTLSISILEAFAAFYLRLTQHANNKNVHSYSSARRNSESTC